jgi:hypothetical protein
MAYFGRGPNKVQKPYNLRELYEHYIQTVETSSPYAITYQEFMRITEDYLKQVSEGLLSGKGVFKVPHNLGYIDITKKKVNINRLKRIDWKATVETGKTIYHLNEHSNGFDYRIEWSRIGAAKNAKLYVFVATRKMKRTLAKLIKNREIDYYGKS